MKTKIRRVLSVLLALCMMFGTMYGSAPTAQAANGGYELYAEFPTNNSCLLPNGSSMQVKTSMNYDYQPYDNYSIGIVADSYDQTEQGLAVIVVNDKNVDITANTLGNEGMCNVTLGAYIPGNSDPVATYNLIITLNKNFYDVKPSLEVAAPGIGETLNLTSCFTMEKYSWVENSSQANVEIIPIFTDSNYKVEITADPNSWSVNGNELTRISAGPVGFHVAVLGTTPDESGNYPWYAGNTYRFDAFDYSVSWDWDATGNGPMTVNSDGTATYSLNTGNVQNTDYTVAYTLGVGPWSSMQTLPNQSSLYTPVTDSNTGKVTGIILDGNAISQVCSNGSFVIKAEVSVKGYKVAETCSDVNLLTPNYNIGFMNRPTVSNLETAKECYLDVSNLQGKDYDIDFTLGRGSTQNFTPFSTQSGLFTKMMDSNTNKVTGISLNGAAIGTVLGGNNFEIKADVKVNGQIVNSFVQSVSMSRTSFSLSFYGNPNNGMVAIYEDATAAELILNTNPLQNLASYDIDFELGTMGANGPSSFVPFTSQTGLFTKVIDSNSNRVTGISLNGAAISQLSSNNQFIVKVDTKIDGYVVSTNHLGVDLLTGRVDYSYYYGTQNMLPGRAFGIDSTIEYYMENGQHPNGLWGTVDVTDVTVQVTQGASDVVEALYDGNMWNVVCSGLGEADITVTHETVDGSTMNYTFTVSGVDSLWSSNYWNKDGLQNAVQGGNISIDLEVVNTRWDQQRGQYTANTPFEVEWYVTDPNQAQYLSFVYNNADKTDITIQVAANAPEEDYDIGYVVYELDQNGNRVADSTGNVYPVDGSDWVRIIVMNEFPHLFLNGYTKDLEVGETITVTPVPMLIYLDNGVEKKDPITGATFGYWENGDVKIEEKNGSFEVTRLASWEIWECGIEVEAPYTGDLWRTGRDMYFPVLDYSTSFKTLRGQDETTWMYDNEEYTLEVDMTNLAGKRANITFDWMVVEWIDEDNYEEVQSGYTVNGNTITLNAKELAAMGLEAISVAALVESNGYPTDSAAYADVEILKSPKTDEVDTTKPVENVTPVVEQTAVDAAVKEAMTVVDAIDAALADEEITVDSEGKIDKLPAALEGVVTKETAEAIIQAKAAGDVISVEIVADNVSRDEAVQAAAADVAKIEAALPADGKVAQYLELSVVIKAVAADGTETELGTLNQLTKEKMTFAIVIPKELNVEGRNFYVLRVHNGVVDKLPATKNADGTISFTTDRYSTYALAYEDVKTQENQSENDDSNESSEDTQQNATPPVTNISPATGDDANVFFWILLVLGMLGVVIVLQPKKKAYIK